MADDKRGRDAQADDADRRQRERDVRAAVERGDEPEPPIEAEALETELESLSYPATGAEVVGAVGDLAVESAEGAYAVGELVPDTDAVAFEAPEAVRQRVRRPTVAAAMKRVEEASGTIQHADLRGSQREAYEKTFLALEAVDADDDDEGIEAVADWIVDRIRDRETLPGSRAVRRRAAKFCRANGYPIRDDEWLGA